MTTRRNDSVQGNLPPMLLADGTHDASVRPKSTHDGPAAPVDADALSAALFDEALTAARISTAEVAFLLQVSESLVRRMRSKDARERVSFAQMLRLPVAFHIELHRAMNRRFGFGRAAIRRILDDLGLVLAVGE